MSERFKADVDTVCTQTQAAQTHTNAVSYTHLDVYKRQVEELPR